MKKEKKRAASPFVSFMITVKLFFGISYLAMPSVFSLTGELGGILLYTTALILSAYTMIQLMVV